MKNIIVMREYLTFPVMFGSGAVTGMEHTVLLHRRIQKDPSAAIIRLLEEGVGVHYRLLTALVCLSVH